MSSTPPTPQALRDIARTALSLLASGSGTFETEIDGRRFAVSLAGGGAPDDVPDRIADRALVAADVGWRADHTLRIDAPRRVLEIAWRGDQPIRIMVFSRGDWEAALARLAGRGTTASGAAGASWIRLQGTNDALLNRVLTDNGYDDVPLNRNRSPELKALTGRARELAPERDGPVAATRSDRPPAEHAALVKARGLAFGADRVGIARLRPEFVEIDHELGHDWVIGLVVAEDYRNVVKGAKAVEVGAHTAYARCAESSTALARYIREELGYPAIAHHNGGNEIQALPTLYHAGIGELGRHGSLINPDLGAYWRPGFVTTTLPLEADAPIEFGVQDYCLNCRLCETVCPGDAVAPAADYIVTDGVKRWLIDNEKCYPYSRLRDEYCHLCVDVCPYIHKENRDPEKRSLFKSFMAQRKAEGYSAPKVEAAE